MFKHFRLARKYCGKKDGRNYLFGAMGLRSDGTQVFSRNIMDYARNWRAHAEARLCSKLDVGSVVWVVKISKCDGAFDNAKPCPHCEKRMRMAGVSRCYYTINENEYGVLKF